MVIRIVRGVSVATAFTLLDSLQVVVVIITDVLGVQILLYCRVTAISGTCSRSIRRVFFVKAATIPYDLA